ncbi:AmmeMemoRadiSam system radical SAM enzyme [Rhodopirellula sp. MGV]|uniref:AmmeMemoRadiSam system radical SAM enzyme n=1 Tax=Rhodopirellula sp. MGV TaxID=2023130 RepID=UPI000B97B112|nr:AmmeMemoRadiSam system radical SAM enzyme [Rhodopirellula sp. MGV]OYP30354.1 hypothetical protein CGZ80_23005 [Rhodopirellula sp. MGV]PNY34710.1 AmmeMemoRadiSam system radical SAM enzyme [Rhodopirellula baltica]
MTNAAQWYRKTEDGRLLCELCPRACHLHEGDRGFCFVRKNEGGQMVLDTYGKSTGFCIDPIEKKPLNHFLPGTPVLSFGTAGCNLGCKFCQNWDISKSREVARLSDRAMPNEIAAAATKHGCRSVAFTYNDPVIWAEYAIDTAIACREAGIKAVAVTAGYITSEARSEFFGQMDAANIDLKAFTESFYFKLTGSHLQPVLDTIEAVCNETDCWVELTNLIIPDANDSPGEIEAMCEWIIDHVGPNVPLHFTAFHPDFRLTDRNRTEHHCLIQSYEIAKRVGLNYVYLGNVHDTQRQSTYCDHCQRLIIERDWHQLGQYSLRHDRCAHCDHPIPGVFEAKAGDWGARRQRVRIEPIGLPSVVLPTIQTPRLANTMPDFTQLTEPQKQTIIHAASQMIQSTVLGQDPSFGMQTLGDLAEMLVDGVFLTVKRGGALRGCCGQLGSTVKLGEAMWHSATRTARDPRMAPLSAAELPYLNLSVSLLGPPREISERGDQRAEAIEIGKHGLRISLGQSSGLLLPQVATEQGWNSRQFLDAVCRKAGLPAGTWQRDDARLMLFDGVHFDDTLKLDPRMVATRASLLRPDEVVSYHQWIRQNLVAMCSGATPMYYASGLSDAEVLGLILVVDHPVLGRQQWMQLGFKESRPLQSTLFQMTQRAAGWLGSADPLQSTIEFAVLTDCNHHGDLSHADWRGFETAKRAIILTDQRRWAIGYQAGVPLDRVLHQTAHCESFRSPTQAYSMACCASSDVMFVSTGPKPNDKQSIRQPAVAGAFYPAEDNAREAMVDQLIAAGSDNPQKRDVFAVMVPHAGLRFSGRVAAEVWRRINVPSRVLILGPKHTPDGMDWAVAPYERWMISQTAGLSGDKEMATQLAERLEGFELDSAAHAREHGIEVQLPLMYRLCPTTKLTAIAMHGATVDELEKTADQLAQWWSEQAEPPLLVVSSDMNHFAEESENRRRDRLALDALASGDGAKLLEVCRTENVSMCGQLPAALILMVMKRLGKKVTCEEIAYATSADAGGDRQRVVGYAGVILG